MARILRKAGLPGHWTCHSHRHGFCSILMSAGVSPAYVQAQAGHQSIVQTMAYASHLPIVVPGAADMLAGSANAVVAPTSVGGTPEASTTLKCKG